MKTNRVSGFIQSGKPPTLSKKRHDFADSHLKAGTFTGSFLSPSPLPPILQPPLFSYLYHIMHIFWWIPTNLPLPNIWSANFATTQSSIEEYTSQSYILSLSKKILLFVDQLFGKEFWVFFVIIF
jgi:hypothetical protein